MWMGMMSPVMASSGKPSCAPCAIHSSAAPWRSRGFDSSIITSWANWQQLAQLEAMPTVVLSAFNVANFPEGGGHFWVYMQYVQGLQQVGCDVYWLERFRSSGDPEADRKRLSPFFNRMQRFGLGGKTILYYSREADNCPATPGGYLGASPSEAEAIFERADLLLNFHYAIAPGLLRRFRRTALVDIDPGLLQFWISRGQLAVPPHDLYFTTGETVGTPGARFPDCGLEWIRIRPPVCLVRWPYRFDPQAEAF